MSFRLLITPNPPPAGNTGSPGDGADCSGCHSDFTLNSGTGTVTITSNIPVCGYVPLTTYSITAAITHNGLGEFQFQLSPQNIAGTYLGTLIPNSITQLYS